MVWPLSSRQHPKRKQIFPGSGRGILFCQGIPTNSDAQRGRDLGSGGHQAGRLWEGILLGAEEEI